MNGQELEFRAATVADVSFPKRTVELVVVPYETEAPVVHHGRMVTEIISRGAFAGIDDQRTRIVKANRDHDRNRVVGRAVSFDPNAANGLVAEIRMSRTELGEETLTLADEGLLDASAGFTLLFDKKTGRIKDGAEVWEGRNRRRLNHLWLHHIAFTPEPVYEDARVLSVRAATSQNAPSMPNLAQLELERLRAEYDAINRRYSRP